MLNFLFFLHLFVSGNKQIDDCSLCEPGKYCQGLGNIEPTGQCKQGFYCPAGQSQEDPPGLTCSAGYKCPTGSATQQLCDSGSWTDLTGQWKCKECTEGYYCDRKDGPITDYSVFPCPNGFYCPNGTRYKNEYGCPNGTYGNETQLTRPDQCLKCPSGKYCLGNNGTFSYRKLVVSNSRLVIIVCFCMNKDSLENEDSLTVFSCSRKMLH